MSGSAAAVLGEAGAFDEATASPLSFRVRKDGRGVRIRTTGPSHQRRQDRDPYFAAGSIAEHAPASMTLFVLGRGAEAARGSGEAGSAYVRKARLGRCQRNKVWIADLSKLARPAVSVRTIAPVFITASCRMIALAT